MGTLEKLVSLEGPWVQESGDGVVLTMVDKGFDHGVA